MVISVQMIPRLAAHAQHQERVLDNISVAQEKIKIRSTVSTEWEWGRGGSGIINKNNNNIYQVLNAGQELH